MGLKCLLGHDFGDPELKREREERGDEMVVTVREVTTCTRCGTERIVSENKEVTSIEQLSRAAADEPEPAGQAAAPDVATAPEDASAHGSRASEGFDQGDTSIDSSTDTSPEPSATQEPEVTDDAEIITAGPTSTEDDEPSSSDDQTQPAESPGTYDPDEDAGDEPIEEPPAGEDDGVILSDTDTDAEQPSTRAPGEWPDHDDVAPEAVDNEPTPWPEQDGDDEGFDAAGPTEGTPDGVTFGGSISPEQSAESYDESGESDESDDLLEPDDGFTRVDETSVSFERIEDDIRTEFFCPECGLTRQAGQSSMRAGDICPECRRGYISERPLDDPAP